MWLLMNVCGRDEVIGAMCAMPGMKMIGIRNRIVMTLRMGGGLRISMGLLWKALRTMFILSMSLEPSMRMIKINRLEITKLL